MVFHIPLCLLKKSVGILVYIPAVAIVKVRAENMQGASQEVPSGMMTVFLQASNKVKYACHVARLYCAKELAIENPVCQVANYLYPECKVLAGHVEASVTWKPCKCLFQINAVSLDMSYG